MLQIHKASAGSGKTHTLTREYIKFLIAYKCDDGRYRLRPLPTDDKPRRACSGAHSHILAITFTNKATNEMTRRIIKELACLAAMPSEAEKKKLKSKKVDVDDPAAITLSSPYAGDFLKEESNLGCTVEQLQEACKYALVTLLYDYSFFNVSTIDSFFQGVLRMFTREVDLPDNYNVELDTEYAINLGVDTLFQTVNSYTLPGTPEDVRRKWISQWLYEYMRDKIREGNTFNVFSPQSSLFGDLVKRLQAITGEDFKQRYNALKPYIGDSDKIVAFKNAIEQVIKSNREHLSTEASRLVTDYDEGAFSSRFLGNLKTLMAGKMISSTGTISPIAQGDTSKATTAAAKKAMGLDEVFFNRCQALAGDYMKFLEVMAELKPLYKQIYEFGLISNVMGNIQEYCRENSLILLSETNNILKGLINDDETPFIYEKLGFYLDHLLIDEFQDTSPMQWENLRALVMESLGRGKDDLVIGDEKQCIYRFRNSDPRLLSTGVQEDVIERYNTPQMVDLKGHEIKDNSNWRSAAEIVKFNNTLFTALAQIVDEENDCRGDILSAAKTYANVIQQIDPRRKPEPGYVKMYALEEVAKKKEEKSADKALAAGKEKEGEKGKPAVFRLLAGEIKRELQAGYKPGDVAILVEKHAIGQEIINFLLDAMNNEEYELPRFDIVSDDSMELGSSKAIRLIVGILRLVNMPEFLDADATAVAHSTGTEKPVITESEPYRRAKLINRYQFYLHRTHTDGTPYTASEALEAAIVDNRTAMDDMGTFDNGDVRDLIDMPCVEISTLIDRLIHDYVPESLKESENLFITSFMDKVIELGATGHHGINDFVKWWDRAGHKVRLTIPANENAITVMTIHKAKGLEFPCVHMPFMSKRIPNSTAWIDLPRQEFATLGVDPALVPVAMPLVIDNDSCDSKLYGAQCRDSRAQSKVDKLNNIYVAFTRATRELIIYTLEGNYFPKNLIIQALKGVDNRYLTESGLPDRVSEWLVTLADKYDGKVFEYGEPTTVIKEDVTVADNKEYKEEDGEGEKEETVVTMQSYSTTGNLEYIAALSDTDAIGDFDINNNRYLGIFCHDVMSKVRKRSDLPLAIRRTAYRYKVRPEQAGEIAAMLERALENPQATLWFDPAARAINERAVTINEVERRPDRVVMLPDGRVEVVDYKFVESLPEDVTKLPKHKIYVNQVRRYCRAVKDCATRGGAQGYIWYITNNQDIIVKI